ncbi:MAG TPA: hypothetical protein ENI79_02210 [Rhodospirillales bacterium]|nr:hypothetical protein [Rhodospirillales bacterium]
MTSLGNPFLTKITREGLRNGLTRSGPEDDNADIYFEEVRLQAPTDQMRGAYVMPLVTLRTAPCRWAESSGCTMCGYHLGAASEMATPDQLVRQTEDAMSRLDPRIYPALVFTSNGSFLDPREVPDDLRPRLMGMLARRGYQTVVIETRAQFVTSERLQDLAQGFGILGKGGDCGKTLSVSLGLESCDPFVLAYCVNKGSGPEENFRAINLVKAEGLCFDCYVLLGKLFLSAREDIKDACRSIAIAVDRGTDYVFVMVTNLTRFSLMGHLVDKGRVTLPSLWRAVDLLDALPEALRDKVQIKGISHAPVGPEKYSETCPNCTHRVKDALNFWNQTGDFEHISRLERCSCYQDYLNEEWNTEPTAALFERVFEQYQMLAQDFKIDARLAPNLDDLRTAFEQSRQTEPSSL